MRISNYGINPMWHNSSFVQSNRKKICKKQLCRNLSKSGEGSHFIRKTQNSIIQWKSAFFIVHHHFHALYVYMCNVYTVYTMLKKSKKSSPFLLFWLCIDASWTAHNIYIHRRQNSKYLNEYHHCTIETASKDIKPRTHSH